MLNIYKSKKVLITGHTGFKGSWLSMWLSKLGADVYGLSNNIPTNPSNFGVLKLNERVTDNRLNLNDAEDVKKLICDVRPDYLFHLGAQALVRPSYDFPLETLNTNAIGTANVLEALRFVNKQIQAVFITSDKAYDNLELKRGYVETDILGGKDPYSASKGMAELAIKTYYHSYFKNQNSNIRIAIARAGNVIGGGDWAKDRIIPDCVKAWANNESVEIRNPEATRPWQHVLEPLGGYLLLGAILTESDKILGEAFNFGPPEENDFSVRELIEEMRQYWSNVQWIDLSRNASNLYEANLLKLNCEKAQNFLSWCPTLNFKETIKMTVEWYKAFYTNADMYELTSTQIKQYSNLSIERGSNWIQ
jgi:CDP-glucose 4,6-dehydratase